MRFVSCLFAALLCASASAEEAGERHAGKKPNRLVNEKSPYLLQHAYNPVNWYPWGPEAFRAAREQDKPVFLSIGYSTCHWCHVMERESFEDEAIAAKLNQDFISIKVDREERPDVDEVYMAAVMATEGRGGWPLSAFLTPDGKPFFLGTYFPPRDSPRLGMGFLTILERLDEVWKEERQDVVEHAERIAKHLQRDVGPEPMERAPTLEDLKRGFRQISRTYDQAHGGFGYPPRYAPKFPRTSTIDFLLAWRSLTGEAQALEMSTATLDAMANGGIFDHVGKGFHRYATDRRWLVPHFEKMLYDNCLIPITYLDAFRLTGEQRFLTVATESLGYLLTRMRNPDGGFHSAEDADSEGEEGKYYVFDRNDVDAILGKERAALFAERYGITERGNFEHGKTVLHVARSLEDLAADRKKDVAEIAPELEKARLEVLAARAKRIPPLLDDKVLTDWNAFAISAMAIAHQATGDDRYLEVARGAANFIEKRLVRDGVLLHRWREGEARYPAYFEDHAFLATALLDLYEAGLDERHLASARRLALEMITQFWDGEKGGFFHTGPRHEKLIITTKEFYDGAIPSGNSVAASCLNRLAAYTGDAEISDRAKTMARLAARLFEEAPERHPELLEAAADALHPRVDIVIAGPPGPDASAFLREVHRRYLPNRTVVRTTAAEKEERAALVPWLAPIDLGVTTEGKVRAFARRGDGEFTRIEQPGELGAFLDSGN